ncbi:MAG: methionine ABC transporter permease [Bacillota bacterium]
MSETFSMLARYNELMWSGLLETLYMVGLSLTVAVLAGVPLGVVTTITREEHILPNKSLNTVLDGIINIGRSIPFIILMVAVIPFTRMIVGTSIGTTAAVVPLSLAAIPFMARIVDNALLEVDPGVIKSAQSMGATPWQIVYKVLLPESLPAIILGITLTAISLISYSAMAGAVGGGGLGDIAIRYGYQRFKLGIMLETIVILVLLVQAIQWLGNKAAGAFDHR